MRKTLKDIALVLGIVATPISVATGDGRCSGRSR